MLKTNSMGSAHSFIAILSAPKFIPAICGESPINFPNLPNKRVNSMWI